jgi:hypothetical protein
LIFSLGANESRQIAMIATYVADGTSTDLAFSLLPVPL